MGKLFYGAMDEPTVMSDRLLAHVKVVVATKLRRNESFTISWRHESTEARGRTSLWLHPSVAMRFVFDSAESERLDSELLRRLADDASSTSGLVLDLSRDAEPALARELLVA